MKKPLVSIIVPVYNQCPEFLRKCIDSAIAQSYPNLEIIVSDNHSTNETSEILKQYLDPRIVKVRPPEHLAMTPHFQWASEHASGEYISFLPSDDWLEDTCIEELVKTAQQDTSIVMAFCEAKQFYNNRKADFIKVKTEICTSDIELRAYIRMTRPKGWIVGCLFRNSIYKQIGGIGDGDLNFTSDRWLFIRFAALGSGAYVSKPLAIFRNDNPNRLNRIYLYSVDVVKVMEFVEDRYLDKIPDGKRTLRKEKNRIVASFLKDLPPLRNGRHITEEEFDKTLGNLKKLATNPTLKYIISRYEKRKMRVISAILYMNTRFNNLVHKVRDRMKI